VRGRTPKLKPMFEDSARSVATAARGAGAGSILCFAAALAISMFRPRLRRSAGLAGGAAVSILADAIAIVALLSESWEGQRRAVSIEAGGRFRGREDLSRPAYLMAGLPRLERPGWYAGLVAETRSCLCRGGFVGEHRRRWETVPGAGSICSLDQAFIGLMTIVHHYRAP